MIERVTRTIHLNLQSYLLLHLQKKKEGRAERTHNLLQGPPNNFFLENALKKTTEYFLKFRFLFESTILPVNNEK